MRCEPHPGFVKLGAALMQPPELADPPGSKDFQAKDLPGGFEVG